MGSSNTNLYLESNTAVFTASQYLEHSLNGRCDSLNCSVQFQRLLVVCMINRTFLLLTSREIYLCYNQGTSINTKEFLNLSLARAYELSSIVN